MRLCLGVPLLLCAFFAPRILSATVNRTIDDFYGDLVTGAQVSYMCKIASYDRDSTATRSNIPRMANGLKGTLVVVAQRNPRLLWRSMVCH